MNRVLGLLYDFLGQVVTFLGWAFFPTAKDVCEDPALLLHPFVLRRIFFSHVWAEMSQHMDAAGRDLKANLITPHAYGVVLDIGAGHGHTASYLDRSKVTRYVALEPNKAFHGHIRRVAEENGFLESNHTLLILGTGAEDCGGIIAVLGPHTVDTLISVLSFCSVPSGKQSLRALAQQVLKPGGQLLSFEHIESPVAAVRRLQAVLNPFWGTVLDGCVLGRPIFEWIHAADDWAEADEWEVGEEKYNLFFKRAGRFVRKE
ncbi:hypothetical protein AURDEDRAFT_68209 [Auricularia subglabra TFB-10046 SS5]|nr:hypothetical protein AURDEDRAFT_68209 [Auricularia subglabra TFB-10046 SS5]